MACALLLFVKFNLDFAHSEPERPGQVVVPAKVLLPTKPKRTLITTTLVPLEALAKEARRNRTPSHAFLVLGLNATDRPVWAAAADGVLLFPPSLSCAPCPADALCPEEDRGLYGELSDAWWCAQRSYMEGVSKLLEDFPNQDYYMIVEDDTVVLPGNLQALLRHLDSFLDLNDDLYMGHGFQPSESLGRAIMVGGGVLLRGRTLLRVAANGRLKKCAQRLVQGPRCRHRFDWALAECLREVNVLPHGHEGFQQHSDLCGDSEPCCRETSVACHRIPHRGAQLAMVQVHLHSAKIGEWTGLCKDGAYDWVSRWRSACTFTPGTMWSDPQFSLRYSREGAALRAEGQAVAAARGSLRVLHFQGVAKEEEEEKFEGTPPASVAFMVLGLNLKERPVWASGKELDHELVVMYQPPQTCAECPADTHPNPDSKWSGPYAAAPKAWWCTQRTFLEAMMTFSQLAPNADYYMIVDWDTIVFPEALAVLLRRLDEEVLSPSEDLYMGHGVRLTERGPPEHGIGNFIMSGGGVLLRGRTLRRLVDSGTLAECAWRQRSGPWCWHHLDWVLGECLREIGVPARGHVGFQQYAHKCVKSGVHIHQCCSLTFAVACHSVDKMGIEPKDLLEFHRKSFELSGGKLLDTEWATPCKDALFWWNGTQVSRCPGRHSSPALEVALPSPVKSKPPRDKSSKPPVKKKKRPSAAPSPARHAADGIVE